MRYRLTTLAAPPLCCPTGHRVLLVDPSHLRPAVPQAPYRSESLLEEEGFDPPAPELRQYPEEYHPQLVCPPTPQKEAQESQGSHSAPQKAQCRIEIW